MKKTLYLMRHGQTLFNVQHKIQYQRGIKNCAIFRYEYEDGQFSLQEIINHDFSGIM